jgi:hypothetical protein
MTFQPGNVSNPNGRPKGSRNRRTQEILDLLQGRGDKDPLDYLSEVITTENNYPAELKVQASNILAPYLHSKRGTAPAPRFIDTPVVVPQFQTVQEAEAYLASLPGLLGRGELDSQSALELSTLTKNWLDSIYSRQELDLKLAAQGGGGEQTIRIEGGMPSLPGTEIIMPGSEPVRVNGMTAHGPVIEHTDTPAIESKAPEPS